LAEPAPPFRLVTTTSRGDVSLRAEQPDDEAFLYRLFAVNNDIFRQGNVPPDTAEALLAMQHRARTLSYRAAFPSARFWIVEFNDSPVGRYIENDEPDAVYVVDIALLPEFQRGGFGSALIRSTQRLCAPRGMRAKVLAHNEASLKMFRRFGFEPHGEEGPHIVLVWPPPR